MNKYLKESADGKWGVDLANDLAFIKRNRRYPFNRMTMMPLITSVILVFSLSFLIYDFILEGKNSVNTFPFLIAFLVAVPILASIGRYFNLIRFRAIHTSFYVAENMNTLQQFLDKQKLITFRHPDMPEVFQIISKNISVIGEDREVLIFIADDKRILVNSHYTSSRKWFRLLSPPTHEAEMIRLFMSWLKSGQTQDSSLVKRHVRD